MADAGDWLVVAVGMAAAVLLIVCYVLARGGRKDSLSGLLALGLAVLAVSLPILGAVLEPEHLTAYAWVCLVSTALGALALTAEWRLASLRVWIVGVALAMTALLVVLGNAAAQDGSVARAERLRADHDAIHAADRDRISQLWAALARDQVDLLAEAVTLPDLPGESDQGEAAKAARQERARAEAAEQARLDLVAALTRAAPQAADLGDIERVARRASRVGDARVAAGGAAVLAKIPALRDTPEGAVAAAEDAVEQAEKTGGNTYRTAVDRLAAATAAYRKGVVEGAGDPGTWPVPELSGDTQERGWFDQLQEGGQEVLRPVAARAGVEADRWLWGTLALLALLAWWFAERRTNIHAAGPVVVTVTTTETETETKPSAEATLFRNAIRKNVSEPGTYPGAGSQPLADLQTLVGVTEKGPVAAAISLIKTVVSWPRGSLVDVFVVDPPTPPSQDATPPSAAPAAASAGGTPAAPAPTPYRVLVTIRDAATRRQIDVKEFRHQHLRDACTVAGHWAAAVVISSSPRFPRWATWSPRSAAAFADVDTIGDEPSVTDLEKALVLAPSSGLLLHRLGDALEFAEQPVAALEHYARSVQVDRTQFRSPYRLAAVSASLSRDLKANGDQSAWRTADPALRDAATAALNRALRTLDIRDLSLGAERLPAPALLEVAHAVFGWVADQQSWRLVLWRWASRSQRDSLGPLRTVLSPTSPSTVLKWMALSGRRTASKRPHPRDPARAHLDDPRALAPMLYNLACCAALHDQPDEAIDLLERALSAPLAEQVTGPWLEKDPDLVSLHSLPRFQRLTPTVSQEEE